MPVVSDASPLILLAKIRKSDLLTELYSQVLIPEQVKREVVRQKDEASLISLAIEQKTIRVEEVEVHAEVRKIGEYLGLHEGEMYALSLALYTDIEEILVDDKMARVAARAVGLKPVGCLGIAMKAHNMGLMTGSAAVDVVRKLVKAGLWISPEILGEVITSLED